MCTCSSAQGKIHHQSLFVKMDYVNYYAVYQIFFETFGVVRFVTKVEIVKKLTSRSNSQRCIAFVKASRIHSERKFWNRDTLANILTHLWEVITVYFLVGHFSETFIKGGPEVWLDLYNKFFYVKPLTLSLIERCSKTRSTKQPMIDAL
jgi:hypothetical protein